MTEQDLLTLLLISAGRYDDMANTLAGRLEYRNLEESVSRLMADDLIESDEQSNEPSDLRVTDYGKQTIKEILQPCEF